jgi:cell division septal protein FtsQ
MRRSSIQSPVRLRIAVGLVAAERSPRAYMSARMRMQREFAWAIWFLVLFALLHLVILVVLFAAPR